MRGLYLLLLVSGVLAAWQAHELWGPLKEGPSPGDAGPVRPTAIRGLTHTRPAPLPRAIPLLPAQSQPAGVLLEDAFPDPAVEPLDDDPVGVPAPPGATGLRAFSLPASSVTAQYLWQGSVAEAAGHYQEALQDQGCKLLGNSIDELGRRSLTFTGNDRRVIVVLRPGAQEANMVVIEVTVTRPPK